MDAAASFSSHAASAASAVSTSRPRARLSRGMFVPGAGRPLQPPPPPAAATVPCRRRRRPPQQPATAATTVRRSRCRIPQQPAAAAAGFRGSLQPPPPCFFPFRCILVSMVFTGRHSEPANQSFRRFGPGRSGSKPLWGSGLRFHLGWVWAGPRFFGTDEQGEGRVTPSPAPKNGTFSGAGEEVIRP